MYSCGLSTCFHTNMNEWMNEVRVQQIECKQLDLSHTHTHTHTHICWYRPLLDSDWQQCISSTGSAGICDIACTSQHSSAIANHHFYNTAEFHCKKAKIVAHCDLFCCVHCSRVSMLLNGLDSPQNCPFPWEMLTPCGAWFLGPTWVSRQNASWSVQPFLHGSQMWPTDRHTMLLCL